jgi:hypothetical protein
MRLFTLVSIAACCFIIGCSSLKLRVGPLGTGIATTEMGPGVEAALSDKDGEVLAGFRVALNLPKLLNHGYQWIRGVLPVAVFNLWPTANTPTGPEVIPVEEPTRGPIKVAIRYNASPG